MPGMDAVLRRVRLARVQTAVVQPDTSGTSSNAAKFAPLREEPIEARAVVNWSSAPASACDLPALAGLGDVPVLQAGGTRTLEDDRQTVSELGRSDAKNSGVVVLVKSWEPPVDELMDFLDMLRNSIGRQEPIVLVPVDIDASGQAAAPTVDELRLWRDRAATTGDPWLRVSQPQGPGQT